MNNSEQPSEQVKKTRAENVMLLFCFYIVTTPLAWLVYELGIKGLQGLEATRSLFFWAATAWTIGIIFPFIARHWAGWVTWVLLGVSVYTLAYLVLGL
ncbi:hypothetical protein EOM57_04320 [Candidatus Saccharibacteria bacterium]|nr:hypothetical protein [Candidatus Saccharibacteria bacterium]